ncbi:hypothetical protein V5F77_05175 [Xanthobacter sp. DSM 24535]|uniref:hypothetical protein n=1 Tax=Roseixanthobacter psychrophilus TaxID=3119917 RepID=UPI0037280141
MADKPRTDWEAIESYWRGLYPKTEAGAERMAVAFLPKESVWREMGWPDVRSIRRQVSVGRGICDIVVTHVDGSITIIEVKNAGLGVRDYCTGIGQLAYQSIMAASDFQAYRVRKVLAMPGQFPVDVALACIAADVDMFPMPTIDEWVAMLCASEAERAAA